MFSKKTTSALCLAIMLVVSPAFGQRTRVTTGWNLFTPQQDVELGRSVAQAAEPGLNLSTDQDSHVYLNALGNQVATYAPGYKYPWMFKIFKDPSIQSFALPGGWIYVSSGLVEAAQNEPQLAALLAHQIGHVVARHGTERASTAYANSTGSRRNVPVADVIRRLDLRVAPGATMVRYSVQEEQEADTIATQMLYDAKFDPRILTTEFQQLNRHPNSLEFFRDHPAPANRAAVVRSELQRLGPLAANLRGDSPDLHSVKRNLRNEPDQPEQQAGRFNEPRPDLPSTRFVTYQGYDFEIRHPENWYVNETGTTVTVAPEGGNISGSIAYGMVIDTFQPRGRDFFGQNSFSLGGQQQRSSTLSNATDQLIDDLRRSNPNLRVVRSVQKQLGGNAALEVELNNDSPLGGREVNRLTTVLHNDVLFYFMGVSPQSDYSRYISTFDRMIQSVRFY